MKTVQVTEVERSLMAAEILLAAERIYNGSEIKQVADQCVEKILNRLDIRLEPSA